MTQANALERDLTTFMEDWMKAIAANDVEAISPYMAEEWALVTLEAGPIDKARFLGAIERGDLVHHDMRSVGEPLVRVYGDTAVMVSRVQNSGTFQGQPFTYDEWSSDTLVRTAGGWRCVLTALTPSGG